jgi:4a-hydroxytetrahydrobiopterin dehydratase
MSTEFDIHPPTGASCIRKATGARHHDSPFHPQDKQANDACFRARESGQAGKHAEVKMSETTRERVYSEAEIEERLKKELPKWWYEKGWIRRKYKTHSWKSTLMIINTVGHLAEAAWHHPDITASYAWVEVRLMNHAAKGVTDKDFELARKIEEVVHWQPAKEGGALEGTPPTDQRFAYIKYD